MYSRYSKSHDYDIKKIVYTRFSNNLFYIFKSPNQISQDAWVYD